MYLNNINNTNFQARLDISSVKSNKARWKNIAKVFKEETKLIPDETVKIIEHEFDTSIIAGVYPEMRTIGEIEAITFNKTLDDLLKKNSDETIAKKLYKLLDIGSTASSRKEKAYEKYEALADKESWVSKDLFINKRNIEYDAIEKAAVNKANKDAFLRNFEIVV